MSFASDQIQLPYGLTGKLTLETEDLSLTLHHQPPKPLQDVPAAIQQAFANPIDFPPYRTSILPDDSVVVVVDDGTPAADLIVLELYQQLAQLGIKPEQITLLQPASLKKRQSRDPRSQLPVEIRDQVKLVRHDPTVEDSCAYLASTANGERIYLSKILIEADVVVTIGLTQFHPEFGISGTNSVLFPGLSDVETLKKRYGQAHDEVGPDEARTLRQIADEVGWLLGLQLSIAVVASAGDVPHQVLVGLTSTVQEHARKALEAAWTIRPEERVESVLLTVTSSGDEQSWDQVANALDVGRKLVQRGGRILLLSQLESPLGPGLEILKSVREPKEAIRPIQRLNPPDTGIATQVAKAADWARVSFLSKLPSQEVTDLFLFPIESEDEIVRLLQHEELSMIVESAQNAVVQRVH